MLAFVVFALVPAVAFFRLNQWIAYGGTFGEYYTYGLQAYLSAFAIYWATFTIYLVLYAAVLRVGTEAIVLPATWIVPARAATARRAMEIVNRILYYGAVFALLLRLYLQSE
jgi:apolipoprotein N-acyltransferase